MGSFSVKCHLPVNVTFSVTFSCFSGVHPVKDHVPSVVLYVFSASLSVFGVAVLPLMILSAAGGVSSVGSVYLPSQSSSTAYS